MTDLQTTGFRVFVCGGILGHHNNSVHIDEKGIRCSCDKFLYRNTYFLCEHIEYVLERTALFTIEWEKAKRTDQTLTIAPPGGPVVG